MNIVVIGGVAAGTKAAAKLMREDRGNQVVILTKGKEISYAGCGLPYYVGHVIEEKESLIVNTPESFSGLTGAAVHTQTEVTAIDRAMKTVTAQDLVSGKSSVYPYDKLIIATGARPFIPPVEGTGLKGVFTMRTPDDAIALREAVDSGEIKRAVVVGGGFIGLEVADNLAARNVKVSIIDMAQHILPGFDPEIQEYVENHLADNGIIAMTGTKFEGIEGQAKVEKIRTSKRAIKADAVILAIGIQANTEFLQGSGLEMMPNHTLKVENTLQTNDPDIYAVGDCACVFNAMTQAPQWSPMGSSANLEGRIAARHIAGHAVSYRGVVGTGICHLPGLDVGRTGLTEEQAKAQGFDAVSVLAAFDSKAHYYPGAGPIVIKLIADKPTERILGVQAFGAGAVDKVIDVAVTAIYLKATLTQLSDLDFAYAPPFSTAIHPLDHAVNVLKNKIDGVLETFTPLEYASGAAEGYKVIDVSKQPAIEGAQFVSLPAVNEPIEGLGLDDKLLLVCTRGKRAYMLQNRLKYLGYTNTKVLEGGTLFNGSDLKKS